jgi:serine/threonine protein phosphatase PrpC
MAEMTTRQGPSSAESGAPPSVAPSGHGSRFKLVAKGATDVGRKRDHNEDSFLIDEEIGLFVVCDGMGGHAGGGTASRIAVETIDKTLRSARDSAQNPYRTPGALAESPLPEAVREAVEQACMAIFKTAQDDSRLAGMGTTASVLVVHGNSAFIGHVGDSRVYLVRGDLIQQISEDHSLVNEQIKAGMITADEARNSRFKNIITRSVGFEEEVAVDVMGLALEAEDTFIVCCDGLSNLVDDRTIRDTVRTLPLDQVPQRLVELANEAGGDDNITVIAVRVENA